MAKGSLGSFDFEHLINTTSKPHETVVSYYLNGHTKEFQSQE